MAKKINLNFLLIIAISIFLTVFSTAVVSYQLFKQEVFSDLSSFAEMTDDLDLMEQMKLQGIIMPENELRITWIAGDGSVLYDSYTKDAALDNHSGRPEIIQAKKNGEGSCIRRSQTTGQNIFFYARTMEDGTFLRIAKEAGSIWNIYRNALPVTAFIAALSFAFCLWIASRLTKAFVRPIEQMAENLNRPEQLNTYKELMPFIALIHSQHEEMMKHAKIRQEFTANVSHELKTPLASISGYSELIATGMASKKEARHFAAEIHDNAKRLLTLINDILQLSELDAVSGQNLSVEPVDLYELAAHCMETMAPVAEKHGISLSLEGTSLKLYADKALMEEMLCNLCDNAIRYNKKGGHVWITVTDRLTVWDDGIGIPQKHQKRVFERFFRVDKSRSKKTGGTGLGLAIVKHIAEAHHADISLDSEENIGTAFCVRFPDSSLIRD